jgi:phage tail P2-like protein
MTIQILHPNGTSPLFKTVEETMVRASEVDVLIGWIDSPELAPDSFIPYLAWGSSTDLWDRDWPVEKKRAVAKAWYRLHSKKGTLTGIKEAVRFFGAEVVKVRRPPDGTYPDPSLTREEREKFLGRFQQIRFYSTLSGATSGYGAYLASGYRLDKLFPGAKAFPFISDCSSRIGRRAFVYDPLTGVQSPVRRVDRVTVLDNREALEFDEVDLPGRSIFGAFAGRKPMARSFTVDGDAKSRRFSIAVQTNYNYRTTELHFSAVEPSGDPVDVNAQIQKQPGARVKGQLFPSLGGVGTEYVNRPSDGAKRVFLPPTTSRLRVFEQIYVYDEDRQADRRGSRTFLGNTRLGMPPYNASMRLETRAKISWFAAQQFTYGFLVKTSKARLNKTIEAVRLSKSLRDKITVTAKTMRPATVADGVKLGTITVGTWVRDS